VELSRKDGSRMFASISCRMKLDNNGDPIGT